MSDSTSLAELLVDQSPDALFALSFDGNVLSWNAGAEKIFGYAAHEAIGRYLSDLITPTESREARGGRRGRR